MQAQKEAPSDMQCKDKFLLQSVVATPGVAAKDITQEMVTVPFFFVHFKFVKTRNVELLRILLSNTSTSVWF